MSEINEFTPMFKKDKMTNTYNPRDTKQSTYMQILLGVLTNLTNLAPGITLGFSAILLPALYKDGPQKITVDEGSWIASAASITMPIGCLISGPILDRFGRKITLYAVNVVSIIGWICITSASEERQTMYVMLLIGRVITGVATGMGSIPATVYLSEISTPKLRAMLATWTSVFIAIGVLIVYVLGLFLRDNWRISAGITIMIPAIAIIILYFVMPESPQWLVSKHRNDEAQESLARIWRTTPDSQYTKDEIAMMISNVQNNRSGKSTPKSFVTRFKRKLNYFLKPNCIKPFLILTSYFFFQQFSGTFVIVFYAVEIVKETGVAIDPYLSAVILGISRVVASFMVGPICKIYGRRPPSIVSGASMTLSIIVLAGYLYAVKLGTISETTAANLNWLPIVLIVVYFFTSSLGFLTIPFAMIAEMYPTKVRGLAGGLTACFCYICNFIAVKTYPKMRETMEDHGLYAFYGGVSLIGTVFVYFLLPETKGKTLMEMEEYFSGGKKDKKIEESIELNGDT